MLTHLRDVTGESAQLYRRQGDMRICVAAAERLSGLRDTVPVGSTLPMKAGSAAQVLMAWEEPERLHRGLQGARFTATALSGVRRRGWAQSIGEREPGVASVSAPVRGPSNRVVAAVSVSGPIERLTRHPGRMHAQAVDRRRRAAVRGAAPHRLSPLREGRGCLPGAHLPPRGRPRRPGRACLPGYAPGARGRDACRGTHPRPPGGGRGKPATAVTGFDVCALQSYVPPTGFEPALPP